MFGGIAYDCLWRHVDEMRKYMRNVVIIVPYYKNTINVFERTSISQLFYVLGEYPICFVVPESLDFKLDYIDGVEKTSYFIERFSDSFFVSTESYSGLCLSEDFYRRFFEYEYMLIYQLDAFVFSNRLSEFIDMGYDYIGAAMKNEHWKEYHVGNGGLSLRNIKKSYNMVKNIEQIIPDEKKRDVFFKFEDTFFGYCGYRQDIDYSVAPIDVANRFSVDDDSFGGFREINDYGLPFGTHRYVYAAYPFWKKIIEAYGYNLPRIEEVDSLNVLEMDREKRLLAYIPQWFAELESEERYEYLSMIGLVGDGSCRIWGAGYFGNICVNLLMGMGVEIDCIFDNARSSNKSINGVPIVCPNDTVSESVNIIIAVKGRFEEIKNQIVSLSNDSTLNVLYFFDVWEKIKSIIENKAPLIEGVTCPYTISVKGGVCGKEIRYPE